MKKNTEIDYTIKNQLILYRRDIVVLTSGKMNDDENYNQYWIGRVIAKSASDINRAKGIVIDNWTTFIGKQLLSPLPPSLNIYIHDKEKF